MDYQVPNALQTINTLPILPLTHPDAALYGQLIKQIDVSELISLADRITEINPNGNTYVPGLSDFEALPVASEFRQFFDSDIQVGYCNGPNTTLNGMEYHKSPELFIAVTDAVQFLCLPEHLKQFSSCDTSCAQAFYFPKGSAFLLHSGILHLSPCCVHEHGFKSVIVLPKGTNLPLDGTESFTHSQGEARLLAKKNKWILAHPERTQLTSQGIHPGLCGANLQIHPIS